MMECLVTGGAGFIGSHLCEKLIARDETVHVVDDLSTGRRENLAAIMDHPRFHFAEASIRDQGLMRDLLLRCDEVYHLAAAVGVKLIVESPIHTIETNIHGTDLLLRIVSERAGRGAMPRVLITSTSEVYGKGDTGKLREDDDLVLGPTTHARWSYACSKAIDEFLALAYYDEFDLPAVIVRLFNTVGPRQVGRYGMVLPRFVQQALKGEPLTVYDDGRMVRCFCHVDHVTEALIALNRHPESAGQVYNVGSDKPVTVLDLARRVKERAGSDSPIQFVPYEKAYRSGFEDIRHRAPDISKVTRLLGYRPRHSLDQIIDSVIAHYRSAGDLS